MYPPTVLTQGRTIKKSYHFKRTPKLGHTQPGTWNKEQHSYNSATIKVQGDIVVN
jgi:hypothetical protein